MKLKPFKKQQKLVVLEVDSLILLVFLHRRPYVGSLWVLQSSEKLNISRPGNEAMQVWKAYLVIRKLNGMFLNTDRHTYQEHPKPMEKRRFSPLNNLVFRYEKPGTFDG